MIVEVASVVVEFIKSTATLVIVGTGSSAVVSAFVSLRHIFRQRLEWIVLWRVEDGGWLLSVRLVLE